MKDCVSLKKRFITLFTHVFQTDIVYGGTSKNNLNNESFCFKKSKPDYVELLQKHIKSLEILQILLVLCSIDCVQIPHLTNINNTYKQVCVTQSILITR